MCKEKQVVSKGKISFLNQDNKYVMAYKRNLEDQELMVLCNLRGEETKVEKGTDWKLYKKVNWGISRQCKIYR